MARQTLNFPIMPNLTDQIKIVPWHTRSQCTMLTFCMIFLFWVTQWACVLFFYFFSLFSCSFSSFWLLSVDNGCACSISTCFNCYGRMFERLVQWERQSENSNHTQRHKVVSVCVSVVIEKACNLENAHKYRYKFMIANTQSNTKKELISGEETKRERERESTHKKNTSMLA